MKFSAENSSKEKPKMIICGASAYSRDWDYARIRAVADEIGALVMAAAKVGVENPNCHSYSLPSASEQATKYSPQLSRLQVVAVAVKKSVLRTDHRV